jgi:hypothetical protein
LRSGGSWPKTLVGPPRTRSISNRRREVDVCSRSLSIPCDSSEILLSRLRARKKRSHVLCIIPHTYDRHSSRYHRVYENQRILLHSLPVYTYSNATFDESNSTCLVTSRESAGGANIVTETLVYNSARTDLWLATCWLFGVSRRNLSSRKRSVSSTVRRCLAFADDAVPNRLTSVSRKVGRPVILAYSRL